MVKKFDSGKDWSFEEIDRAYQYIREIAEDDFGISYYPNQIEIISSEQMLDAYSSVGMPVSYSHWSFGKTHVAESEHYRRGRMGLAYEIVINSNPCIAYLMEENTMMMQCLVMAHACFGHNGFFKNNCHFKQWTDAEAIIDYLSFARNYIRDCEERYGEEAVESVLDSCHALRLHGIDRYKRPPALSREMQRARDKERQEYERRQYNDVWRTLPQSDQTKVIEDTTRYPAEPQENLLYFIEKHAPNQEEWKLEIIRIVRKIAQYFYPQQMTQIMNEGYATFMHYNIINKMYDRGLVTDGFMMEFLASHSGVVAQPQFSRINPYALGFAMYKDIKRVCTEPTKEDELWFPNMVGKDDWLSEIHFAAQNFKDESFILQYLSPTVARDFGMFYLLDDDRSSHLVVEAIQDEDGFATIRSKLAEQQNVNNRLPNVEVTEVDLNGDRVLHLTHKANDRHQLEPRSMVHTLYHTSNLWGYDVNLHTFDPDGNENVEYYVEHEEAVRYV